MEKLFFEVPRWQHRLGRKGRVIMKQLNKREVIQFKNDHPPCPKCGRKAQAWRPQTHYNYQLVCLNCEAIYASRQAKKDAAK